jgi:hypothetical protein
MMWRTLLLLVICDNFVILFLFTLSFVNCLLGFFTMIG